VSTAVGESALPFLEVRNLSKAYGWRHALRGVSFDLAAGEVVSVVGANGAGKTTLLRVLAGLLRPSGGTVRLGGWDRRPGQPWREAGDGAPELRQWVGYVAHDTMLYGDLSAEENLHLYARLYELPDGEHRAAGLLARLGLADRRAERVRTYSHGMQRRLALARALLHRPRLLLLDEPTAGLDAEASVLLDELVAEEAAAGCAVLLATHDLPGALTVTGRVLVLAEGRLVLDAPCGAIAPERLATLCRAAPGAEVTEVCP